MFGHLRPGVTIREAEADANTIGETLQRTYPKEVCHERTSVGRVGLTAFGGAIRGFVAGLTLLAFMILLAACANLGGLFAAHTADRSREVAMRLALGSSRTRIVSSKLAVSGCPENSRTLQSGHCFRIRIANSIPDNKDMDTSERRRSGASNRAAVTPRAA